MPLALSQRFVSSRASVALLGALWVVIACGDAPEGPSQDAAWTTTSTLATPPDGAFGFRFGQTEADAQAVCESAGRSWLKKSRPSSAFCREFGDPLSPNGSGEVRLGFEYGLVASISGIYSDVDPNAEAARLEGRYGPPSVLEGVKTWTWSTGEGVDSGHVRINLHLPRHVEPLLVVYSWRDPQILAELAEQHRNPSEVRACPRVDPDRVYVIGRVGRGYGFSPIDELGTVCGNAHLHECKGLALTRSGDLVTGSVKRARAEIVQSTAAPLVWMERSQNWEFVASPPGRTPPAPSCGSSSPKSVLEDPRSDELIGACRFDREGTLPYFDAVGDRVDGVPDGLLLAIHSDGTVLTAGSSRDVAFRLLRTSGEEIAISPESMGLRRFPPRVESVRPADFGFYVVAQTSEVEIYRVELDGTASVAKVPKVETAERYVVGRYAVDAKGTLFAIVKHGRTSLFERRGNDWHELPAVPQVASEEEPRILAQCMRFASPPGVPSTIYPK